VSRDELEDLFNRYGLIEEVDIKRGQSNAKSYAFLKYINLDMAYNAKVEMSGKFIGKLECKIGYGNNNNTLTHTHTHLKYYFIYIIELHFCLLSVYATFIFYFFFIL
jgi:RNA recognition motif-containing protein